MKYLLGVDIGTTSLKAAVFNEKAECLKTVVRDYTLDVKDDYVEFDANGYWELFSDALEELAKDYKIKHIFPPDIIFYIVINGRRLKCFFCYKFACKFI